MKIVGICASPRRDGNSEWALNFLLNKCSDFAEVEHISLCDKNISFCDGCLSCYEKSNCHYHDDMTDINNSLMNADIVIVSTPVYFDNVPAILKNLIDRTNPICDKMDGKKAIAITFGEIDEISWHGATNYLDLYFDIMGMLTIENFSFKANGQHEAENSVTIQNKLNDIAAELRDFYSN